MSRRHPPFDGLVFAWAHLWWVGVAAVARLAGPWALVPLLPALLLALEPSALAVRAAVRGRSRTAWWATRLSLVVWRKDRRGGAALMAARAELAAGRVPVTPEVQGPVSAGFVMAEALAASARGDREGARALVAAAGWFERRPTALAAVRQEWIGADLAARGRWDALADLTDAEASTPRLRALRAAAARLLDRDDAPDAPAFERLAGALRDDPRWRAFLDRARAARHRPAFVAPALPAEPAARALEAHRRALLDPAWLDAALSAWDDAPPSPPIRARVLDDLHAAFVAAELEPDDGPGPMSTALGDVRHGAILDDLTAQADALRTRTAAAQDLDPLAEARAFSWFVVHFPILPHPGSDVHAAALRRRERFRACQPALLAWSADLYNRRGEGFLFRAVTRWLLAHATLAGDEVTAEVLRRNLAISRSFR